MQTAWKDNSTFATQRVTAFPGKGGNIILPTDVQKTRNKIQ